MIIPQGKVLVRAGRFEGGKLPYLSYVGQIKPADIAKIIFWGPEGNDITGNGLHATPYQTFDKALEMFSSIAHKWILRTDLGVYDQAGLYVTNAADRVYLDPTRPDDSGDGLTPATAKQTYAAAKTALTLSGRSSIHCIGSFTLTSAIDAQTQGQVGQTLTVNPPVSINRREQIPTLTGGAGSAVTRLVMQGDTGIAVFTASPGPIVSILRSTDGGKTFSTRLTAPADFVLPVGAVYRNIATNGLGVWVVVGRTTGPAGNTSIYYSTNDGLSWTRHSSVNAQFFSVTWSGTHFVAVGFNRTATTTSEIWRSTDGISWTSATSTWPASTWTGMSIASDGNGKLAATARIAGLAPYLQTSEDHGATWTLRSALFTGRNLDFVGFAGGRWWIYSGDGTTSTPYKAYYATAFPASWTERVGVFSGTASAYEVGEAISYSQRLGGWLVHKYAVTPANRIIVLVTDSAVTTLFSSNAAPLLSTVSQNIINEQFFLVSGNQGGAATAMMYDLFSNVYSRLVNATISPAANVGISNAMVCNITAEPNLGTAVSTVDGSKVYMSRAISSGVGLSHLGRRLVVSRSLVKSPTVAALINGTALVDKDIELSQSVFIGAVSLNNPSGTDKEYIQDNIIEGGFSAAALVTVRSNIRGAVTGTTAISKISSVNPVFADTTDYFLSRVALGQVADSPLVKRSTEFAYTYNSQTYKDDFGPYRAFIALVTTLYKRSFLLPKFSGEALSEDVQNSAKLLRSINGVPDVSNRPSARMELISWEAKTIDENVREAVSYMERERNTGVELFYDFEPTMLDGVTVNGAHPAETFEINIQPKDIPVGTAIIVDGKTRYVVQRYPRSGDATKIVIDDVLQGGLSNGQVLDIELMQGGGSFVFVPQETRKNRRVFSRRRDAYKGMVFTFARKLT